MLKGRATNRCDKFKTMYLRMKSAVGLLIHATIHLDDKVRAFLKKKNLLYQLIKVFVAFTDENAVSSFLNSRKS